MPRHAALTDPANSLCFDLRQLKGCITVEIKEIDYENFGNCVLITNGIIDVVVTIDFGPRIIRFGFSGKENLFYNDVERLYKIPVEAPDTTDERCRMFYYYGGHRLWLSPERSAKTVLPDNDAVVYSILPDGVRFLQPKQKTSNIQTGFEIIMGEDAADIMVVHTAKNCSKEPQPCGLWPITMLEGDGVVILPQNTDTNNAFRPNRTLVFWPGTDVRDERIFCGNRYLTLRKTSENDKPLKIGCNNVFGWAAFIGPHYTFMKRYVHNVQAVYPDFGSSCEVSLEKDFTEIQSLSPMYRIEPGQGIKHVENFSVFQTRNSVDPKSEDGIAKYIENLK
jgi:hypothetical protein